jgi:hypothetical protein
MADNSAACGIWSVHAAAATATIQDSADAPRGLVDDFNRHIFLGRLVDAFVQRQCGIFESDTMGSHWCSGMTQQPLLPLAC